jgi:hypothetical protein
VRRHPVQQCSNDVVLQYRAKLDFFLALDDVEQRGTPRDLNVLDADVLVHGNQHRAQCPVDLRAILEAQQMIQIVQHFREHLVTILVHDGGQQDLILVGVAGYRESGDIVSSAGGVCCVVESEELERTINATFKAWDVGAV